MSPSETLVTVPVTVRIAASETGMFINVVNAEIKNIKRTFLKRNIFDRMVYNFYCFLFLR